MTEGEIDEAVQAKLDEGRELLNQMLIQRVQMLFLTAGPLADRPRVAAALQQEAERMKKWHEDTVAALEAALLRAAGRLH